MTVKELIVDLLNCDMDHEVRLGSNNFTSLLKVDEVEETRSNRGVYLNFEFEANDLDLDALDLEVSR